MTYREIQAIAKTMGIPANKKKDEIVSLIMKSSSASIGESSVVAIEEENIGNVESIALAESAVSAARIPVECVASTATAEKTPLRVIRTPAPAIEEKTPYTDDNVDIEDPENHSQEIQEKAEIFQMNNLVESFSNIVRLNGLPTPQGNKTIFDAETPVLNSTGYFVNWGLSFTSPAGKETSMETSAFQTPCRDDCENSNPQYCENEEFYGDCEPNEKPANSHAHFFSPEMKIGSQVHWRYEDYDLEAQTHCPPVPPCTSRKAQSTMNTPAATAKKFLNSSKKTPGNGILVNAVVPDIDPTASPQTRQDSLMSFWLSKGTPGKALFR
jgi:hypothetical protein